MTFAQVWTYLRWPLAILGLLAVANYALNNLSDAAGGMIEFDASGSILAPDSDPSETELDLDTAVIEEEPAPTGTLQPGTGPVTDGGAPAITDLHVNDTIADIDADELLIGDDEGDAVVVAFDIPAGDPGCMSIVNLNLTVTDAASTTEIGVFASTVDDPAGVDDNQAMEPDLAAIPEPFANALVQGPGTLTLDITAGFQQYFEQGFPQGRPFVLTIVPTVPVEPLGGISLESVDAAGENPPTLLWTGTPGCPAEGTTTTATPTEG